MKRFDSAIAKSNRPIKSPDHLSPTLKRTKRLCGRGSPRSDRPFKAAGKHEMRPVQALDAVVCIPLFVLVKDSIGDAKRVTQEAVLPLGAQGGRLAHVVGALVVIDDNRSADGVAGPFGMGQSQSARAKADEQTNRHAGTLYSRPPAEHRFELSHAPLLRQVLLMCR